MGEVYIVGAAAELKYINNEVINWDRDGGGERSRGGVARDHQNRGDRMWRVPERQLSRVGLPILP